MKMKLMTRRTHQQVLISRKSVNQWLTNRGTTADNDGGEINETKNINTHFS